jgi:hypothetical protein
MNPNNYYKVSVRTTLAIGGGPGFVQTTPLRPNPITDGHCERARILTWVFPFHSALQSSAYAAREAAEDLLIRLEQVLFRYEECHQQPALSVFDPGPGLSFAHLFTPGRLATGIGVFPEPTADTTDPEFLH